jgi:hypothetical protein
MQYEYESATKRLQEELDDPGLKVIFDDETQEYQVLKYTQTGCDRGYYSFIEQANYKKWDEPQVIKDFKMGDYRYLDPKKFCYTLKTNNEKTSERHGRECREEIQDINKDIYKYYLHPNVVSIPGVQTTRLKGM